MPDKKEILLSVKNLRQYFNAGGGKEIKAVDDVSFDVYKGEVFGLVGESGCGKTTTGRSIIKLYDITSGSVFFKGQRICAGTRSYEEEIGKAKSAFSERRKELSAEKKKELAGHPDRTKEIREKYAKLLADAAEEKRQTIAKQKEEIGRAKSDHKHCEKKYLAKLKEEYAEAVKTAGCEEALSEDDKKKFAVLKTLPKTPKKVFVIASLLLAALACVFLLTSIVSFSSFHNRYGDIERKQAIVKAVDAEAGTTDVTYSVNDEKGNPVDHDYVLRYYDPDLGVSTEERTVRLTVYLYYENGNAVLVAKKPQATGAKVSLIFFFVCLISAVVIALIMREKYNPARLVTRIQMIFQDPIASLNPRMTVRDIIAEGLEIEGVKDKAYIDDQVYKMLELVGLVPEHAGRYPHEFSGGQRQRIGVARSMIMNPDLIIADEPVSALDVSVQAQVINLLNDLRAKLGLTVLFIAHDLSVVKYFSDRIGVMYFGKMVELASSDELFAHPLHPYTKSLLSAIPLPDPEYEKKRTRFVYNPLAEHDYSVQKPTMREISPGHFVSCNDEEFLRYRKELGAIIRSAPYVRTK